MRTHLNAFQITALETYLDGTFSYLASLPVQDFKPALANCGDILLVYIVLTLSSDEGCHTRSDAILRLSSAAEDIDSIVIKLDHSQPETPSEPNNKEDAPQQET